jgi:WD40 repeat protein
MFAKPIEVADQPWHHRLVDRVERSWSKLRDIAYGLWIARVSAASVIIGSVLFYYARPAQDLFFEVRDTHLSSLGYWGLFYFVVLLFWVFPVYLSARWILARVDVIRLRRPGLPAVEDRVRRTVPAVLAAGCLVAVLIGQVLAVSNAPILTDKGLKEDQNPIINQRIKAACPQHAGADPGTVIVEILDGTCKASFTLFLAAWKGISQWAALTFESDHLILIVYAICAAVLVWMLLRQRAVAVSQKSRQSAEAIIWWIGSTGLIIPIILLFWTGLLLFLLWIALPLGLRSLLFTSWNWLILLFGLLVGSIVLGTLSWWRRAESVLWWAFTIAIVAPTSLLTFVFATGFVASELEQPYGLWHLAILLPVSAAFGMLVWWGLSPGVGGRATRVGHFLMWLRGKKGPIDDAIATERLVNPIFAVLAVAAVVCLILLYCLVLLVPVAVSAFPLFSRSLLIALLLGMLVPPVTLLSCWSLKAQKPLVLGIILLVAVASPLIHNPHKIRTTPTDAKLQTFEESLERWATANKCDLGAADGSALACPAPIIVAAAGGASRAAFQVAGLMGMLMDETRPPVVLSISGLTVFGVGFSPDGHRIWTRSSDRSVRLWDGESGARGHVLKHEAQVASVRVSVDNRRILTSSFDDPVRIWSVEDGSQIAVLGRDSHGIATFSPDGRRILTRSGKLVRLWDGERGTLIGSPLVHEDIVSAAIFSPDGRRIFTSTRDKTARLWDAESTAEIGRPRKHDGAPRGDVFSPDNRRFLTRSGKTAQLWDADTGTEIGQPLDHASFVRDAVFSSNGSRLVTRTSGPGALLWDAERAAPISPLKHEGTVNGVVFSPDNLRVVTWAGSSVHLWNADNGAPIFGPLKHEGTVTDVVFSPTDGRWIVSSSADGTARLLDGLNGSQKAVLPHRAAVHAAVFNRDGSRILTRSADRTARLWDSENGTEIEVLKHDGDIKYASFSPKNRIVTHSFDKTVRLWDGTTGAPVQLGSKKPKLRSFDKQLFAISGVSGGALGAVTFYAALADSQLAPKGGVETNPKPPCNANASRNDLFQSNDKDHPKPDKYWKDCLQLLLAGDFLSPIFLSMIGGDLLGMQPQDRTAVLEKSWETRYLAATSDQKGGGASQNSTLAKPMLSIRDSVLKAGPENWLPILLLNGTSVQTGRRIIASDIDTSRLLRDDGEGKGRRMFRDAYDLRESFGKPGQNESENEKRRSWDIGLSTAATISARFPGISPHGDIVSRSNGTVVDRVVDGGYYENFGAATALELVEVLDDMRKHRKHNLTPLVILVNNEPGMPDLDCEDAERKPAAHPHPDPWALFATWRSPFDAVLGTRRARGTHAAAQLCDYVGPSRFAFVTVGQQTGFVKKKLSMSWWLSKYVQRYLDGELIKTNAEPWERIMAVR